MNKVKQAPYIEKHTVFHADKKESVVFFTISSDCEVLEEVSYDSLISIRDLINVIEQNERSKVLSTQTNQTNFAQ